MKKILNTPHWVLFTMVLTAYLRLPGFVDEVVKVIASGIVISWIAAVGYYGEQKRRLMGFEQKELGLFQFNSVFTIVFSALAIFAESMISEDGTLPPGFEAFALIIVVGFLYFVFAFLHIVVFSARTIAEVEYEGPVTFSGYVGKLLMFLFFGIGVWMLQPKVKRYLVEEFDEVNPFDSV